ncbi:hypothetical protein [Piscinibacter gummiphilus]|uniref:Uncharacterized protein n=1 Tax=Piscinibacter gummiphilus TaxID=946333 RepID=A0ABZ0D1Q5_9BURK|nr:hypothetical protein [Piscinibacter gummiphilus]WOB11133.1 hypothetical protein RXV79_27220 [Piscinibacter gummiphilus]
MKSQIALQALISILCSACVLLAYDRVVARPSQQIGVVDLAEVYRSKEAQFAQLLSSSKTDADRKTAHEAATSFARDLTTALEELPRDCRCLVMLKTAVVGRTPNVVDLTPTLRSKLDQR